MTEENKLELCYKKAKEVIDACTTKNGLYASAGKDGYNAIWSRDSMISMLGGSLVRDKKYKKKFQEVFKNSIKTLAEHQSKVGQIPNAVDKWDKSRKSHVDFKTIDSSLWFIIGNYVYKKRYRDASLMRKYKINLDKAYFWLDCQDSGETGTLTQLPTSDWQDAFPHRYGDTINTQALYYHALNLKGKNKEAEKLKKLVNENKEDGLWDDKNGYYYSYRWKNHGKYREISDWFDTLGNLLAIVYNLADKKRAENILKYIEKNKLEYPYPIATIHPPITRSSVHWRDYYLDCDAGIPGKYSNGGIWGYVGGFYILALIKMKKFKLAKKMLELLAERNLKGNFPEWTHSKTKKHYGKMQAWEAGMYILAYKSFKSKKILI
jgi:glycogen debranching enzyme